MPPTLPIITRVVLVLTAILGLAATFVASRVVDSGWMGAVSLPWFLAPSAALLAVAWWRKNETRARPAIVASTWVVVAPLALWLALVVLAVATVRGEAGLGAAVALGYAGFLLPLVQLAGTAAVGLISLARPLRDKSAGFLAGVALVLVSATGVLLYSTGTLPWLGGQLLETFVTGPSRRQAAAEYARRPPNQDVRWDQAQAARRKWLDSEGSMFVDGTGRQFRKRPGWQEFKTTSSAAYLANGDHVANLNIEGDMVPADAPDTQQTYSGPATFSFHRNPDGHWILTQVRLDGPSLRSDESIDLAELALPPSRPPKAPPNPPTALTADSARAAVEVWLSARYPLGDDLMKDPGGTVEVLGLQGQGASIRLDKVPYHRLRDGGRHEYSGPGSAQFSGNRGGQWVLTGVWLSELNLWRDIPAQWTDSPDHGILVR